jgi:hypothetical protein
LGIHQGAVWWLPFESPVLCNERKWGI